MTSDLSEEMQQHLEEKIEELVAKGVPREEAVHAARRAFGNSTLIEQRSREAWMWPLAESLWADIKFALRQLRKSPGFATTAILTLALGIGVATAMFAIVDGVLLRPLVFPHANQLYTAAAVGTKGDIDDWISYSEIQQWRKASHDSAQIAFSGGNIEIAESHSGAILISNDTLSANFLRTLGVQPMLGRDFLPVEQLDGHSHVALLSYPIWQKAFARSPKVLGQTLRIGDVPYSIIGVMPPQFAMPLESGASTEVFTPIPQSDLHQPGAAYMPVVRREPGTSASSLQAELSSIQARIAQNAKSGDEVGTRIQLTGLRDSMVANVRPALTALEIAVGLVWLIACCNVAGLLLARLPSRRVEIAVRGALGAGKRRIVRQFLTESLLVSTAASIAGLGLAALALAVFRKSMKQDLPLSQNIHLDVPVLLALVGFTLVTGLLFGTVPAVLAARAPVEETLKSGGSASSGGQRQTGLRNGLLIGEVAISIVLLTAAGLMLRTVYALRHAPLGFRADHLVLANFTVPNWDYKNRDLDTALWGPLLERIRGLPGVQSAALSSVLPIGHDREAMAVLNKQSWSEGSVTALMRAASPGMVETLGMRMHAGRFFAARDTRNSMPVLVVNLAFARSYMGGHGAIGKQMDLGNLGSKRMIVGVLDDVRQDNIAAPSQPEIYLCMAQLPPGKPITVSLIGQFMELAVRTHTAPHAIIPELRRAIHQQAPNLVAEDFATMEQEVEDAIGSQRTAARVVGTFGGLALLITLVGLYGSLSYSAAQRTREIGIRMAVGADRARVMQMILRQALVLILVGIAVGLALAFWASRFLRSFLYGVGKHDPWTVAIVPCVILLFGMLAALLPARRAASIDPMQALRAE